MKNLLPSASGGGLRELTMRRGARLVVLAAAFLGWMFAGVIMGLFPLAARPATIAFLGRGHEAIVGQWFAWYTCAFLLGAAAGGLVFGWWGDRFGRVRALGASVLTYSLFTGISYWARTPEQLLLLRFLACMGVGGTWPNGIALASEAWSEISRPTLAGLFGTAANVGIVFVAILGIARPVTPDNWQTMMLLCAAPTPLGLIILALVPESPHWLAQRDRAGTQAATVPPEQVGILEVFRPPFLRLTLVGILLGAIPLFGNWSSGNWLVPWTDQAADLAVRAASESHGSNPTAGAKKPDGALKAWTQMARSTGATLGGLVGGWLASLFGRRLVYFLISLGSFGVSAYIFRYLDPLDPAFVPWVFLLGFITTIYFGWLPLCLPELFPTRVRSAGSGVTFNFGRIATAGGVLGAGYLMGIYGDYATVLAVTSTVYLFGMLAIWCAPDTSQKRIGM